MSIEIEVLDGDESWALAETLFKVVWPPEAVEKLPWGHIKWADADLRVLIEAPDGGLGCHVGIFFRTVTWNGRKVHIGGIGGVSTRADCRRRGYASIALNAAGPDLPRSRCRAVRASLLRAAQFRILSVARLAVLRRRDPRRAT